MMKSRYLPLIPAILFSCKLPAADQVIEKYVPIPVRYAKASSAGLQIERIEKQNQYHKVTMRLINPGDRPIHYYGYSMSSPTFRQQVMQDGKWVNKAMGFCGTGLSMQTVPAGQSALLVMHVNENDLPGRLGVACQAREGEKVVSSTIVWSPTIAVPEVIECDLVEPAELVLQP